MTTMLNLILNQQVNLRNWDCPGIFIDYQLNNCGLFR